MIGNYNIKAVIEDIGAFKIGQIKDLFIPLETLIEEIKTVNKIKSIQNERDVLALIVDKYLQDEQEKRNIRKEEECNLSKIEVDQSAKSNLLELLEKLLIACREDSRQGVRKIASTFEGKCNKLLSEIKRSQVMYAYEGQGWLSGKVNIAGIDEVGRGCLAGPVVAGVVILPIEPAILYLNDSKKISPDKREEISETIKKYAIAYGIGEISNQIIDQEGIAKAAFAAMREGIDKLEIKPDYLLVDAFRIPEVKIEQRNIVGGDLLSASIAAGSIVAKVYRDRLMLSLDSKYPAYKLANNKGYGSLDHQEAIIKYGITEIHRKSFNKNIV